MSKTILGGFPTLAYASPSSELVVPRLVKNSWCMKRILAKLRIVQILDFNDTEVKYLRLSEGDEIWYRDKRLLIIYINDVGDLDVMDQFEYRLETIRAIDFVEYANAVTFADDPELHLGEGI